LRGMMMKLLSENSRETKWNRETERGIMNRTSCWLFRIQSKIGILKEGNVEVGER
jgi:hypothetical protein